MYSDEDSETEDSELEEWLPARQSITGTRMFIPAWGSGKGRGLIHETWTTEELLHKENKWAVLFRTAKSDKKMKEGVHYKFTDWKPTNILFARGKRFPIYGLGSDDAMCKRASKILLHVGELEYGRYRIRNGQLDYAFDYD